MALIISHINNINKTIYALLFNETGDAYRPSTQTFTVYTDSTIDTFDIVLVEDIGRLGYYTNVASGLIKGEYVLEVYTQAGGTPNKANDLIQATKVVYWNGYEEVESLQPSNIERVGNVGAYNLDTTGFILVETKDKYGILTNLDSIPQYNLYENNGIIESGSLSSFAVGIYSVNIPFPSGTYDPAQDYNLFITGYLNGTPVNTIINVDINYPTISPVFSFDILEELGYASGSIVSITDAGNFITNLPSSANSFYNGQILRFVDGTLKTQARIISAYTGSTKRVQTNKDFATTPSIADNFIIFPIGGELNL